MITRVVQEYERGLALLREIIARRDEHGYSLSNPCHPYESRSLLDRADQVIADTARRVHEQLGGKA